MNTLRSIGSQLLGLFVDDWAFTLLVLAWVLLFAGLAPRLPRPPPALFFAGPALLTLVFVHRKAR